MNAPERIYNVSNSHFSISRYYGGCEYGGADYIYDRATDTLIRSDVVSREKRAEIERNKYEKLKAKANQGKLF